METSDHTSSAWHDAGHDRATRSDGDAPAAGPEQEAGADIPSAGSDGPVPHSAVRVLMQRSRVAQLMKDVPRYNNILVVEDDRRDAERLASTVRTIFGYDVKVRLCPTLGTALDAVLSEQPDLVFLDDRMGPIDKAEKSVPFLRSARCVAPIIVISSYVDRRRRADVLKLGVTGVIDKDELDSLSICQTLIEAQARKP